MIIRSLQVAGWLKRKQYKNGTKNAVFNARKLTANHKATRFVVCNTTETPNKEAYFREWDTNQNEPQKIETRIVQHWLPLDAKE